MPQPGAPGVCRYADADLLRRTLAAAGFTVESIEELEVPVVEVDDGHAIFAWALAFGGSMRNTVLALPTEQQTAWAAAVAAAAERHRDGAVVRLGGVTRLALARPSQPSLDSCGLVT